jgi:hypothetical protein
MKSSKGHFYELLSCPFCDANLIKHKNYLVCQFHKWGFPIIDDKIVNYTLKAIKKNYSIERE